jgi:hypothetical protein
MPINLKFQIIISLRARVFKSDPRPRAFKRNFQALKRFKEHSREIYQAFGATFKIQASYQIIHASCMFWR